MVGNDTQDTDATSVSLPDYCPPTFVGLVLAPFARNRRFDRQHLRIRHSQSAECVLMAARNRRFDRHHLCIGLYRHRHHGGCRGQGRR